MPKVQSFLVMLAIFGLAMAITHLGRIQRAILKLIDDGDTDRRDLEDLANRIYRGRATRTQRWRVLTAAQSLARRYPEKIALAEGKDGDLWVIRRD